jgi:hypothetical protein
VREVWGGGMMNVLVGCEFSGAVRDAFRRKGHNAWSCDLLPGEGEFKQYHYEADILLVDIIEGNWDLLIAHPPCTYLTVAANKYHKQEYKDRFPDREQQRDDAAEFFMQLIDAPIDKICVENPVGVMSTRYRKPDQYIQPYEFGHLDRKKTGLWLKNLPKLAATNIVKPNIKRNRNGKTASVHHDYALQLPQEERWKFRSRTYAGIAKAMAEQWG